VRNAEQLGIRELDARALVTVIEQHVDAGGEQFVVEAFGGFTDTRRLRGVDRDHDHLEGRDRVRPDDAARIMILFNGRGNDACHTDAVAAHVHRGLPAGFVQHRGAHGLAVFLAEREDVPHLDAARDAELALAGGRGVTRDDVADVDGGGFRQIATPVDAGEVRIFAVGAADEVRHRHHRMVGEHLALESDRPQEPRLRAGTHGDGLARGHAQRIRHARPFLRLDGIELVVAAHQQSHDAAFAALDQQRLDQPLRG
jgi:hypothetical protein